MPDEILHNERALLMEVAKGNEKAFRLLFDHYTSKLYAFSLKFLHDEAMAQEIVQEVFIKVWTHRQEIPEISNFPSWIFILTKNSTLNYLKKLARQRRMLAGLQVLHAGEVYTEDAAQQREYQCLLQEAINKLPPQQKLVYTLSKEDGLKREEIARQLNLSPETIKAHLAHATRTIRAYILKCDNIGVASLAFGIFLVTG